MKLLRKAALAAVVLCGAVVHASAAGLGIGDPAPKLTVKSFVKGGPVSSFEPGKTYVVEFWATWCGPCKTSIPHLTELQKKYKDVTFVGVSVWEEDQTKVKPFVTAMGEKMAYCVAMDDVPTGKSGNEGMMAKSWMTAAGQNGIPTAFIINKEGKVAWIGHPMEMDEPLKKITSGDWNLTEAAEKFSKERARAAKLQELNTQISAAMKANDLNAVVTALDKAVAEDKEIENMTGMFKFNILLRMKDDTKATAYADHLASDTYQKTPEALNSLAWSLLDPKRPAKASPELLKIALKAAEQADMLKEKKDAAIADTLAKAYFDNGQIEKAIETQERAVALAKGTPLEADKTLTERLAQYKKAKP